MSKIYAFHCHRCTVLSQIMACSSNLSPRDVVNALETLTDDQMKELFYHLDVPLHSLVAIENQHIGNIRKIHFVQTWYDNDSKASWEKIVEGLIHIKMKALAERVAKKHILTAPTSSVIDPVPDPSLDLTNALVPLSPMVHTTPSSLMTPRHTISNVC